MGRYKFFCLLLAVVLTSSAGMSQGGFPISEIKLSLGESRDFNIEMSNPLTIYDNYTLSFSGRATTDGYIKLNISSEETNILEVDQINNCPVNKDCCTGELECVIRMDPGAKKNISYTATATLAGQEEQAELVVEALSEQTQLTGSDKVTISTRPVTSKGPVSAPGITGFYLMALAVVSTVFYFFLS